MGKACNEAKAVLSATTENPWVCSVQSVVENLLFYYTDYIMGYALMGCTW
jgi:hypothetical protein